MKSATVLLAIGMGYAACAPAQGLNDPTRPPPAWMPGSSRLPAAAAAPPVEGEPVKLVLVGPTRRFAIVRGELVGDHTASKIVELKRNELVVKTDAGRETLSLFPDVQKTPPKKRAGLGEKEQQ